MKSNLISAALLTALFCAVSGWAAQETPPGELFSGKILEKKLPAGASLTRDPATGLPGVRIDRGNTGADFRFPISEDTAAEMCEIMEYVVSEGGAGGAKVTGYHAIQ